MKTLAINSVITLLLIVTFDVLAYWLAPDSTVAAFSRYHRVPAPGVGGQAAYPRGYFVAHETRGFDIGKNRTGTHWVEGHTYSIWSNSLGCFDHEHPPGEDYVYFAGDSFTWGYAPFEQKFGTLVELLSGTPVFKCGVTHTGQRHQLAKMLDVVSGYGKLPRAVFVFNFENDLDNDYAYPQATVVDGWLINQVALDAGNNIVRQTRESLRARIENKLQQLAEQERRRDGLTARLKDTARQYSLTANLLEAIKDRLLTRAPEQGAREQAPETGAAWNFSNLPTHRNGRYFYAENPYAQQNKNALIAFRDYAAANNIDLVVVLIPGKFGLDDALRNVELRNFLDDNGIRYFDLGPGFRKSGLSPRELYWHADLHFSPVGNKLVADLLVDRFGDILRRNDPGSR